MDYPKRWTASKSADGRAVRRLCWACSRLCVPRLHYVTGNAPKSSIAPGRCFLTPSIFGGGGGFWWLELKLGSVIGRHDPDLQLVRSPRHSTTSRRKIIPWAGSYGTPRCGRSSPARRHPSPCGRLVARQGHRDGPPAGCFDTSYRFAAARCGWSHS